MLVTLRSKSADRNNDPKLLSFDWRCNGQRSSTMCTVVPDAIGQSLKTPLNRRVSDPVSKSQEHFA
jgi:hypothetical protein